MKFKLLFIFLITFTIVRSQTENINISYSSNFEEEVFNQVLNNEKFNFVDFLCSLDHSENTFKNTQNEIQKIKDKLDSKKTAKKSTKKKIKTITKYINSTYLKQFELDVTFNKLYTDRKFNSVTAAGLYCIIFDYYNIPYIINETETSVNLIVYNNDHEIIVQPTNSPQGSLTYDLNFKESYIEYMLNNGLISENEKNNKNIEEVFLAHYKAKNIITKTQLGALQYYNKSIALASISEYKEALNYIKKAYLLYPNNKISYYYNTLLAQTINIDATSNIYNGKLVGEFLNLNIDNHTENTNINNLISSVGTEYLIKNSNLDKFEKFFSDLKETVVFEVEFDQFQENYHKLLANYYYFQKDYTKTVAHLSEALIINPNNLQTKNDIEAAFNQKISLITNTDEAISEYRIYYDMLPFLQENEYHQLNFTRLHLRNIYFSFVGKKIIEGQKHIELFKNLMTLYPNIKYDEEHIEGAFITAASSYDYKGSSKVIETLETGLKYAPNSIPLQKAYDDIKTYKQYRKKMAEQREQYGKPVKTFSEKISEFLKSCWTVTKIEKVGKDLPDENILEFTLEIKKHKMANFKSKSRSFDAEWSIRYNSELLYLIPRKNRNNYLVYKISGIYEDELVLRPFANGKMTNRILTLTKCK